MGRQFRIKTSTSASYYGRSRSRVIGLNYSSLISLAERMFALLSSYMKKDSNKIHLPLLINYYQFLLDVNRGNSSFFKVFLKKRPKNGFPEVLSLFECEITEKMHFQDRLRDNFEL